MKSISGNHAVEGEGYVLWSNPNTTGVLRHFKLQALWVGSLAQYERPFADL